MKGMWEGQLAPTAGFKKKSAPAWPRIPFDRRRLRTHSAAPVLRGFDADAAGAGRDFSASIGRRRRRRRISRRDRRPPARLSVAKRLSEPGRIACLSASRRLSILTEPELPVSSITSLDGHVARPLTAHSPQCQPLRQLASTDHCRGGTGRYCSRIRSCDMAVIETAALCGCINLS